MSTNRRAALPLANYTDGGDRLTDYVAMMLSRQPALLAECREAGHLGPAVAAAMQEMLLDLHPDDGRKTVRGIVPELDQAEAQQLRVVHGSFRRAAEATGIAKSAIQRAATGSYRTYRKAA